MAIVSCQTIGAGGTATIANVSTGQFPASTGKEPLGYVSDHIGLRARLSLTPTG